MVLKHVKYSVIALAAATAMMTVPVMADELPGVEAVAGMDLVAAGNITDTSDKTYFSQELEGAEIDIAALSNANLGVVQTEDYEKIYESPSEDSETVAVLVNEAVATVVAEDGDWYQITSGEYTGYVKKDVLVVGDAELIAAAKKMTATVTAKSLNVRADADESAKIVSKAREGQQLIVDNQDDQDWVAVSYNDDTAYVSSEYVEVEETFQYAKSYEEVSGGAAVANLGLQYVGNPYVWGGSSLTNGTDCSGFTMALYAQFGISLPHSSSAQRSVGRGVSYSEAKPGDIICYSGHVAIYIGNGQIVHASNARDGIKVSNADYANIITVRRIFD